MKRRVLAAILAGAMAATMIAGCGSTEENVDASASAAADTADEADDSADAASDDGEEAADTSDATGDIDFDDDPVELKVALMSLAPISSDITDHVEEALNEISLAKINATVDYQWFDGGSYTTQVPMMLQAGEQLDLIMFTPIPAAGFQSFVNQNQLADISDSIEEYGQGILKYMQGDGFNYLEATSRGDAVYGVGVLQDMSGTCSFDLRGDVLEDLGLTEAAQNATSFDEIKDISEQVVAANTGLNGFVNMDAQGTVLTPQPYVQGNGSFSDAEWLDCIGDSYQYVYADPADDKVKCYFENEKWQDTIRMVREWYEDGLIYKDAQTAQDYGTTLIKNEVAYGMIHAVEMGNQALIESQTGFPDVQVDVAACKVNTASFTKFGMAVPVTTVDQDRAVALLNLIWDDPDYRNTLVWGVEGVDWEDTGKGTATYPDGMNEENAYHTADFLYGNRLETIPWDSDDADTLRDRQKAANAELEVSKYFGFAVDEADLSDTVAAVKNVVDTYYSSLCAGTVSDVDAQLDKFVDDLYGAGMQTLIDEYQAQLDAWLAEQ